MKMSVSAKYLQQQLPNCAADIVQSTNKVLMHPISSMTTQATWKRPEDVAHPLYVLCLMSVNVLNSCGI